MKILLVIELARLFSSVQDFEEEKRCYFCFASFVFTHCKSLTRTDHYMPFYWQHTKAKSLISFWCS